MKKIVIDLIWMIVVLFLMVVWIVFDVDWFYVLFMEEFVIV